MEQRGDLRGNNWEEGGGTRLELGKNMEKEISVTELEKAQC